MRVRGDGEGTIDILPSGRARLRMRVGGKRRTWVRATEAEAEEIRRGILAELADSGISTRSGGTLATLGADYLDHRETEQKARNIETDRGRWERHIASAFFAPWPIENVRAKDVRAWLRDLRKKKTAHRFRSNDRVISTSTVRHCLHLLRRFFAWCVAEEILESNPARDVEMVGEKRTSTGEDFRYLSPERQARLIAAVPLPQRHLVAFSIGTGVRLGEQWSIELRDVCVDDEDPHVWVRYGGPCHAPTKGGKPRRVPLFGLALEATRAWLEALPAYVCRGHNPKGLLFPSPRGEHRGKKPPCEKRDGKGRVVVGWKEWLERAGIERSYRWHDNRHTAASSLVSGWWGRRWSLVELAELLGHESTQTTEIYAHMAESALAEAARQTPGAGSPVGHGEQRARHDSNVRPTAPEIAPRSFANRALTPPGDPDVTRLATTALVAVAEGLPGADAALRALAVQVEMGAPGWMRTAARTVHTGETIGMVDVAREILLASVVDWRAVARR